MSAHVRYWEDVNVGDELASITYELSLLRLVAFVRASGLYDFVHFDRDYAQAVGARDAFISTPHVAGLFSRLLTDWSGPSGALRSLTFRMTSLCCTGDVLVLSGSVGNKRQTPEGEYVVDIEDLNIGHALSKSAVSGSAVIALPSREGADVFTEVQPALSTQSQLNSEAPEFAREWEGVVKEGLMEPKLPLTSEEVHLWCEALEDWNPLYWDAAFAERSPVGGIIAPPASMFFGAASSAHIGVGYLKPGESIPEAVQRGLRGQELLRGLRKTLVESGAPFVPPNCPEVAIAECRMEFFRPLRLGDSLRTEQRLMACSGEKRTQLGQGHFMTWENSLFNQRDELVKTVTFTGFLYQT